MCKSHATNYISNKEHVIQPKLKENEINIDMSIKARHTHGNVVTDACMATILRCSESTRPIFILNIRSHMTLCAHLHVLFNVFNEMRIQHDKVQSFAEYHVLFNTTGLIN